MKQNLLVVAFASSIAAMVAVIFMGHALEPQGLIYAPICLVLFLGGGLGAYMSFCYFAVLRWPNWSDVGGDVLNALFAVTLVVLLVFVVPYSLLSG
ncbi:hypothetical protein CL629_00945 [bacterium]|nr:hypothetical protein [bacterium]|tara:strand:+ start:3700 stop:3987 length:288 start_codon:yes stop_codon:yes gene_type:complete